MERALMGMREERRKEGARINDHHLTLAEKKAAQK